MGQQDQHNGPVSGGHKILREADLVDFDELFRLARNKSAASRETLFEIIRDLFIGDQGQLNDRERALMSDILRQLLHDVERSLRKQLAERLADCPEAPRELVVALANDDIEVAYAILVHSEVLRDRELIEIICHRTLEHQLAIAMRRSVSEPVSDALVNTGEERVIARLLENQNADISRDTMAYLVEQSKRVDSFQNPLVSRRDLGQELAQRMFWWVSAALRSHILENFAISTTSLDDSIEEAVATVLDGVLDDGPDDEPKAVTALAKKVVATDGFRPRMAADILAEGEVSLFAAVLSELTGVKPQLIRRLLFEPGGEGLAIACRASGFDKTTFITVYRLTRKARPRESRNSDIDLGRVLSLFHRIDVKAATEVLRRWARKPGYQELQWQLEMAAGEPGK